MRGDTDIYKIDLRENEQRETDKKEREKFLMKISEIEGERRRRRRRGWVMKGLI